MAEDPTNPASPQVPLRPSDVELLPFDVTKMVDVYSNHISVMVRTGQDVTLDFYQLQNQAVKVVDGEHKVVPAVHKVRVSVTYSQAIAIFGALAQTLAPEDTAQEWARSQAINASTGMGKVK